MKKITFLIAFLLSAMSVSYGQQVSAYTRTVLTGQAYTPITGGTVINTVAGLKVGSMSANQDDGSVLVTLPFTFTYGGNTFTTATFCTNGWVGLGDQTTITAGNGNTLGNLFTTTAPNNTLAPWFGDLGANFPIGSGSMVHGPAGTDVYAFEWRNAVGTGFAQSANVINFMVKVYGPLSGTPGRVEFLYGSTAGIVAGGRAVGIENQTGGPGNFINAINGSNYLTTLASAWPGAGNGYRFDPNTAACTTPTGGTIVGGTAIPACSGTAPGTIITSGATPSNTGVVYAWEQSVNGGTTWVAAVGGSGAATPNYTPPTFNGTAIKYRLKVTCGTETGYSEVADVAGPGVPGIQASGLALTASTTNIVATWNNGNGNRRIVVVSTSPITDPVNGSGPALTAATVFANTGQQIVYDGTGSTVTVTGIPCAGGTYYVKVFEVIRCGTAAPYTYTYNATTTSGNAAVATIASSSTPPALQAAGLTITPAIGSFTAVFAKGSGNRRTVIVSNSPIVDPVSGSGPALTVATVFANTGQQTVYDGTEATVTVTGLPCDGGTYYIKVYEYDRCGAAAPFDYAFNTTTGSNATTYVVSPLAAPTTQATALTVTPSAGQFVANWTIGNGTRRMVIVDTVPITDQADETGVAGPTAATVFANNGPQVVYDGTGTTVTVTGLSCASGDMYYVKVIEYNRCGVTGNFQYVYNNTTGTNATMLTITGPTTQTTNLTVASAYTSAALSWTNGNGAGRMVFVSDTPITNPIDESGVAAIVADPVYAGAQQLVYVGTATTATVTGLSCGTTYYFKVFEYNRCGAVGNYTYIYNTATGTNSVTLTAPPTVAMPQSTSFTGFTSANLHVVSPNWFEARIPTTGGSVPSESNPSVAGSNWVASTVLGTPTAKVNLFTNTQNEWIISPKMTVTAASRVKFKAAITNFNAGTVDPDGMGATDDRVAVLISTDGCGASWTPLYEFDSATGAALTNTLADFSLPIGASYIGQTIQIAFHATDGIIDSSVADYDFHIANVIIEPVPLCDSPLTVSTPVASVTDSGATVTWAAPQTGAPANGYQYAVAATNTPPAAAGTAVAGTSVTINTSSSASQQFVFVRSVCGAAFSSWVLVASFTTLCDYPDVLTAVPGARCGQGTVALSGTTAPAGTLYWYAAPTGGSAISTGNNFTTPALTATTSFYVSAGGINPGVDVPVGAGAATTTTYVNPFYSAWSNTHTQHLITKQELLDAGLSAGPITSIALDMVSAGTLPMIDLSVKIGASAATALTAFDTAATLQNVYTSASYLPVVGVNTLQFTAPFNWDGNSNILVEFCHGNSGSSTTMSRSAKTDVTSYVSTVKNHLSTASAASAVCGTTTGTNLASYSERPRFIFNGVGVCKSPRTEVVATVNPPVAIVAQASDNSICAGESTTLSVTSADAAYAYVWTPGNLSGPSQTVTPAATTTYTVTATNSTTNCVTSQTVLVTVNTLPSAITVTPATSQACPDVPVLLTANGATVTGNASIVTGTTVIPSATSVPNPLTGYYGGQWTQMLYKKSELEAQGLTSDSMINSIAFDVTQSEADLVANFTIRIGHTTVDNMTAGFVPVNTLTTVYTEAAFTPVAGAVGLKVFTFTVPFDWDGTSNIIVEVVHNAGNSGTSSGTITKASTTPFNSVYYARKDTVTPATVAGFQSQDLTTVPVKGVLADRPNAVFNHSFSNAVVWTPVTGLYTNAAATTAYTGGNAASVYAKPTANATYTATVTNAAGCTTTNSATVNVNGANTPTGATSQIITAATAAEATIEDIVVTETGVIWYASLANAIAGVSPLAAGTQVFANTTYYGTLANGSCSPLPVTITQVLGGKGFDISSFSYYPNPVKEVLNLSYTADITSVAVYNLLGQKVIAKEVNAAEAKIDMSQLADGTYIVNVAVGDNVKTIKIVKKQ